LFSLGSVLYAMATGVPPFRGSTTMAVLRHVCEQTPTPVRSLNPNVPEWLEAVIARLMAKDPADRFQSAAEVAALLEGYLAHLRQPATVAVPPLPCPDDPSGRPSMQPRISPRSWLLAAVALTGVLGLLLVAHGAGLLGPGDAAAVDPASRPEPQNVKLPLVMRGPLAPEDGLVCLLVNKNSGRCLSIGDGSANPGARVTQGPRPEQAGAAERWMLLSAGPAFRLRNESSRLVLEIGSANMAQGVQAIHWHDQVTVTQQHWLFEPVEQGYLLRALHSQQVLSIAEGVLDAGGPAIQWPYQFGVLDQCWELRPAYPQEVAWSLQGDAANRPPLERMGPDADRCVRLDPDGLRIVLPDGQADVRGDTGLRIPLTVRGDFDITLRFAILHEPRPADTGHGTRITLGIQTTDNKAASISRTVHADGRSKFAAWSSKQPDDPKDLKRIRYVPTDAKSGRLRLMRTGSVLRYSAAKEGENDYVFLQQYPFGTEDVSELQIVGNTGGAKASLDVRVTDLYIRAASLPGVSRPEPAAVEATEGPSRSWLIAAVVVVLMLMAMTAGVAAWRFRRPRPARVPVPPAEAPPPAPAAPAIAFACSGCGKHLRAKGALAGKRVKCPGCGALSVVPAITVLK
jgi:hypothetical protein